MTRKDYRLIAEAFVPVIRVRPNDPMCPPGNDHSRSMRIGAEDIARRLADRLAEDNPRFDRSRFLTACGITR